MKVIVACEFSGVVRDAFIALGHDAVSCDLLPTESPGPHIEGDIRDVDLSRYDLMIAHPPCTHLAVSGARWFRGKEVEQQESLDFVRYLLDAPVPMIALENPVSIISSRIRKPDQIIQPWMFGHGETKATCLWLKGLPLLTPTDMVEGREARIHHMAPSPDRWKLRSTTYAGIAEAMAAQWGGHTLKGGHMQATLGIDTPITTRQSLIRIADIEPAGLTGPDPSPFLVDHIRQYGVLSPIVVSFIEDGGDDPFGPIYAIIDGRRRVKAYQLIYPLATGAGDTVIPAIVVDDHAPASALTLAMHATRSHNLVVEVEMIDDLWKPGRDDKAISRLTGLNLGRVRKLMKYARLVPDVREAMRAGEVPQYALDALVNLGFAAQADVLDAVDEGMTWREAIDNVRKVQVASTFASLDMFSDQPIARDPLASIRQAVTGLSPAHRRELAAWLANTI